MLGKSEDQYKMRSSYRDIESVPKYLLSKLKNRTMHKVFLIIPTF